MDLKAKMVDEYSCPICGSDNKCGVKSGDCWCFHTEVPQKLREQVALELQGKACICQKCVEKHKQMETNNDPTFSES